MNGLVERKMMEVVMASRPGNQAFSYFFPEGIRDIEMESVFVDLLTDATAGTRTARLTFASRNSGLTAGEFGGGTTTVVATAISVHTTFAPRLSTADFNTVDFVQKFARGCLLRVQPGDALGVSFQGGLATDLFFGMVRYWYGEI